MVEPSPRALDDRPRLWPRILAGVTLAAVVALGWIAVVGLRADFSEGTTCNGIYCGGPFWSSMAGLTLLLGGGFFVAVHLIGFLLKVRDRKRRA